jgi:outer membrane immunogenic protein
MKKISTLVCFSAAVFSTAVFANHHYFYAGINAGIFTGDFDNVYFDQTSTIAQNVQKDVSQRGYTGGVQLGYRKYLRHGYFVGVEALANADSNNATLREGAQALTFSDKTQFSGHADFVLVPGLTLTKTVSAYAKLGLSVARIRDNVVSPVGSLSTITSYSGVSNPLGFAAGLGVSKNVCRHISLFAEADYHDYGTVTFQNFQNYSAIYTHATHVHSYSVVMGVNYRFV